uniref:Uncharacterized protein n=1 Tax=Trichobilharzia regenti TaxID=157069 RepID=A0AA85KD20_TRIRE|nr:unnamed protein product [Trichobilharzia regenti]
MKEKVDFSNCFEFSPQTFKQRRPVLFICVIVIVFLNAYDNVHVTGSFRVKKTCVGMIQSHYHYNADFTVISSKSNISLLGISSSSNVCYSSRILLVSKKIARLTDSMKQASRNSLTALLVFPLSKISTLPQSN